MSGEVTYFVFDECRYVSNLFVIVFSSETSFSIFEILISLYTRTESQVMACKSSVVNKKHLLFRHVCPLFYSEAICGRKLKFGISICILLIAKRHAKTT